MESVYFRSRRLVVYLMACADRPDGSAVPWDELLTMVDSSEWSWKTVENCIYDLMAFGALHRVGAPKRGRAGQDTRGLKVTPLGRAWLEGVLLPFVGDEDLEDAEPL